MHQRHKKKHFKTRASQIPGYKNANGQHQQSTAADPQLQKDIIINKALPTPELDHSTAVVATTGMASLWRGAKVG